MKAPPPGDSKREVALKVIKKKLVKGKEADVMSEMEVLKDLDHPNIVRILSGPKPSSTVYSHTRARMLRGG